MIKEEEVDQSQIIVNKKTEFDDKKEFVNSAPLHEPFLTYLDSKDEKEINQAINYFSKNINAIDLNIFEKLTGMMTNFGCSSLLLETIGKVLCFGSEFVDYFNYNSYFTLLYDMFTIVSSEYPFFNKPNIAYSAIKLLGVYASISQENRVNCLELGVIDTITELLRIFAEPPNEEFHNFHKTILENAFFLIDALFYSPEIFPNSNIIIDILGAAETCSKNIVDEEDAPIFRVKFGRLILRLLRGSKNSVLYNQIFMQVSEFMHFGLGCGDGDTMRVVSDILVGFTGQENDDFAKLIIDDGFIDQLIPLFNIDDIQNAKIIRIFHNISACSDIQEFKKILNNAEIVQFLLNCVQDHKVKVCALALQTLVNMVESDIISITDYILENENFLEVIINLLQLKDSFIIDNACELISRVIYDLEGNEEQHDAFIDHLISDYDINDAIEEAHAFLERDDIEVRTIHVLSFEVKRYMTKIKESNNVVCDYAVSNREDGEEAD